MVYEHSKDLQRMHTRLVLKSDSITGGTYWNPVNGCLLTFGSRIINLIICLNWCPSVVLIGPHYPLCDFHVRVIIGVFVLVYF